MRGAKEEICFHIMHSMKGGCGKSTCALFEALQLATVNEERQAKVLFLDADFKGSALQPLLFRDDVAKNSDAAKSETFSQVLGRMSGQPVKGSGIRHTIAIPDHYRKENNLSRFLREPDFPFNTLVQSTLSYVQKMDDPAQSSEGYVNGYIDFILAAADSEYKDWFRYRQHDGKIAPGIFINRMETLVNHILRHNATAPDDNDRGSRPLGQYENVVIDMPPGYDEYSDMLLEVLHRIAAKETRIKLHYYQVTTDDIGHMALALENIRKMTARRTEHKEFSTVNAILNDPFSMKSVSGTDEKSVNAVRIKENIKRLKDLVNGDVYYNEYNASFHAYSTITENLEFIFSDQGVLKRQEYRRSRR